MIIFLTLLAAICGFVLGRATAPDVLVERAVVRTISQATKPLFDCAETRAQLASENRRANECVAKLGVNARDLGVAIAAQRSAQRLQIAQDARDKKAVAVEKHNDDEVRAWANHHVPAAVIDSLLKNQSAVCAGADHNGSASSADPCASDTASVPSAASAAD